MFKHFKSHVLKNNILKLFEKVKLKFIESIKTDFLKYLM